jgi:hypothetical protein
MPRLRVMGGWAGNGFGKEWEIFMLDPWLMADPWVVGGHCQRSFVALAGIADDRSIP